MLSFIITALLATSALAIPLASNETGTVVSRTLGTTGHYTVSGLGARKKAITACGGLVLDLAIAMLEYTRYFPSSEGFH